MKLNLEVMEIKSAQEWDDDIHGLVATIKLKAKVTTKDLSDIGYLQSCPPTIQCALSTDQVPMKLPLKIDEDTGEVEE